MDGPISFLHVVGGQEIGNTGEPMKKTVFEAKHWGWSNYGCLWVDASYHLLTLGLMYAF